VKYIFLDESGDIGFGSSEYFVVTAVCTDNPKPLYNCIKRTRQKIKKEYKKYSELKFSESDKNVRTKILKCIGNKNVAITYFILEKDDVNYNELQKRDYIKDFSFTVLIIETINKVIGNSPVTIIIDKYLPKKSIEEFNSVLNDFNDNFNSKVKFTVQHVDSRENRGVQIADFVVGAIHMKYRDNNSSFYELISSRIMHKLKFKDHGENVKYNYQSK